MRFRPSLVHLIAGVALVAVVVATVVVLDRTDAHIQVAYPLTTWRMDLDDALVGLGTILLGVAAIWTVALRQQKQAIELDRLRSQLNGGMADLARQHLQESEVVETIRHEQRKDRERLDRIERDRDECVEERRELHERLIACMEGTAE